MASGLHRLLELGDLFHRLLAGLNSLERSEPEVCLEEGDVNIPLSSGVELREAGDLRIMREVWIRRIHFSNELKDRWVGGAISVAPPLPWRKNPVAVRAEQARGGEDD